MTRPAILLTGVTGFVGGALGVELAKSGRALVVVVRAGNERAARLRAERSLSRFTDARSAAAAVSATRVVVGDLTNYETYRHGAFDTVSHVVHAAGCTSFAPKAELWRTNVEGTTKLAARMLSAPALKRFLHVSTAYCCGDSPARVVHEDDAPRREHRHVNEYARSKAHAELLLAEMGFGDRLVVARPSVVIGHTERGVGPSSSLFWYCRAMAALRRGPFELDDRRDIVPVDYVAAALATLLLREPLQFRTYHVSAGELASRTLREMLGALAWREADGWEKVRTSALARLRTELEPLVQNAVEARKLARGLGACARFGELGVQYFDNSRLLREGIASPPSFIDYASVCLATSGNATLFEQMIDDA